MPTFLFWNLKGKDVRAPLAEMVNGHNVDIAVLAECELTPAEVQQSLNSRSDGESLYYYASSGSPGDTHSRVVVFVRSSDDFVKPFFDSKYLTIRRLTFPLQDELLLAAVHLPSRMHKEECDLDRHAIQIAADVLQKEQDAEHDRTIVVGDFNLNPFAKGLIGANAFNAVGVRRIAQKGSRVLDDREHRFFYNPMWSFFDERDDRPPGTYHYRPKGYDSMYWNLFDQVLIRPCLIPRFRRDTLKILSHSGTQSLVDGSDGLPAVSDHLPIVFELTHNLL